MRYFSLAASKVPNTFVGVENRVGENIEKCDVNVLLVLTKALYQDHNLKLKYAFFEH